MNKKNIVVSIIATAILMISFSAPLFLDVLVLELFSREVHWALGLLIKGFNIALMIYCVSCAVKVAKSLFNTFMGLKLK